MFCSGCGKKIMSAGKKCPNCGTVTEPLRSFKKLDIDVSVIGLSSEQKENPILQERIVEKERIVYKVSPKYQKFVRILTVLLLMFIVITIIFARYLSIKNREIYELRNCEVTISESVHNISGRMDIRDNKNILVFDDAIVAEFNGEECRIYEAQIYLDKDVQTVDDNVIIKGKILRIKEGEYVIIPS